MMSFIGFVPGWGLGVCDGNALRTSRRRVSSWGWTSLRRRRVWCAVDEDGNGSDGDQKENAEKVKIPGRDEILEMVQSGELAVPETEEERFSQYEMMELGREAGDTRSTEGEIIVFGTNQTASPARAESRVVVSRWMRHTIVGYPAEFDVESYIDRVKKMLHDDDDDDGDEESMDLAAILRRVVDEFYGETRGEKPPGQLLVTRTFGSEKELARGRSKITRALRQSANSGEKLQVTSAAEYKLLVDVRSKAAGMENNANMIDKEARVGVQMITANWTSNRRIELMDAAVREFALQVVQDGIMSRCVALQATAEPSFFKILEFYTSQHALKRYIDNYDEDFNQKILPFRAAVNRVRQVYSP